MCKELFMLRMIILRTFRYSTQPNFSALVIIQAMIMTKYRIVAQKDIRELSIHWRRNYAMCKGELLEFTEANPE
jgi:hypothetical protein